MLYSNKTGFFFRNSTRYGCSSSLSHLLRKVFSFIYVEIEFHEIFFFILKKKSFQITFLMDIFIWVGEITKYISYKSRNFSIVDTFYNREAKGDT